MDYTAFLTPTLGAGGVVVLAVVMLLRGDLVPRKQVGALLKSKDEAIDLYRAAFEKSEKQHEEKDRLISGLLETAKTTRNVLAALPEATGLNERDHRAVAEAKE